MQTTFQLPEKFKGDAALFRGEVKRFRAGEVSAAEFRSFRVPMGVYEQRESDTYMLRVRFPAGGVLAHQMRVLAHVAREFGNGVLHVTSRQDIQVHRVLLEDIPAAFEALSSVGLSTRGGGGNTVRNILGCADAGVCPDEEFDIAPYALALTEFLLPDPLSYQLPRKYKIAFSGCAQDCAGVMVNDVGFVAKRREGSLGFAVYVGGGMGAHSRVGELFEEFLPAEDVHYLAEAVKRVFDKHGNRKNKHKARLRFLIEKIGLARFRELYDAELAALRKEGLPPLAIRVMPTPDRTVANVEKQPGDGFDRWRQTNTTPQKQSDYNLVQIPLQLGDISADTLEQLADVIEEHGERMVRTTQQQNLVMRWVHANELAALHTRLDRLGLARPAAPVLRNMVACAGASTCRLGICLSRGLAKAIAQPLEQNGSDLRSFGDILIHISGCPNACGRHPIADIGLSGAARRINDRLVPHYVLKLGGHAGEGDTRLADGKLTVPARNIPALLDELFQAYHESEHSEGFRQFLENGGRQIAAELADKHKTVPDFQSGKDYYYDWDADKLFSLAGRGPGECGAGVFDMIQVDLASAQDAVQESRFFDATVLASRALLVTRGYQARSDMEALDLFTKHFIEEDLVEGRWRDLVEQAKSAAQAVKPAEVFAADSSEVTRFVDAIHQLFDNMDPSLRFPSATEEKVSSPSCCTTPPTAVSSAEPVSDTDVNREVDFRGVVCPLNYVRTKMTLDQMPSGQVLSVLLDSEGARNVPDSAGKDGHEILSVAEQDDHWRVLIRKA